MSTQNEFVVAEWRETTKAPYPPDTKRLKQLSLAALVFAALFLGIAIWQRSFNLGLAAFICVFAVISLQRMPNLQTEARTIQVTNMNIYVGQQVFSLDVIAGFWLKQEDSVLVVTFEPKRASLIPITCLFANTDEEIARQMLSQVLAELESRPSHFTDSWSRFLG